MLKSIRIKLLLSLLAVIILAMGLSSLLLLSLLERYFLQATEDSLVAQARITAQALIPGAQAAGPPVTVQSPTANIIQQRSASNLALQTDLPLPQDDVSPSDIDLSYLMNSSLQLGTQLETRIRILDTEGLVLVDSWDQETGAALDEDPLVSEALTGQYSTHMENDAPPTMFVAMPVLTAEQELAGVVYLSQPLRDVTAVLRDVRNRLLLATLIALLLSGVVGLLLSGAITRPIRQLTTAAGTVALGQFDTEVPVRSQDELGQLSRTFNDMTDRLRAAHQMQVDFVANVSHELRTPLTAVKGMVETLRDGAVDDLEVRDRFLETAEKETNRLIRLVNDLLLLSRADSEALNLRFTTLDVRALAQTVIQRLQPKADTREVTLHLHTQADAPKAWADADRIAQVMVNLLDNAIKYSYPGGDVKVSVTAAQTGEILIAIQDTGIGIAEEELSRIGERFYRADKARARATADGASPGGSGLGLAIAQALVAAHGGQLWLESQEGQGTIARFTLPAA